MRKQLYLKIVIKRYLKRFILMNDQIQITVHPSKSVSTIILNTLRYLHLLQFNMRYRYLFANDNNTVILSFIFSAYIFNPFQLEINKNKNIFFIQCVH